MLAAAVKVRVASSKKESKNFGRTRGFVRTRIEN